MPTHEHDPFEGLAVHDLRVERAGRVVLRDVSFAAAKGRVLAVVAPSGGGKSTLLRCLNRLLVPVAGTVTLDGADIAGLEPCALRRRVGLIGQTPAMLPGSVRANLLYGLRDTPESRVQRAIDLAGLDRSFLDRPADELSGGERARVGLAQALTREPEMLLLDEPTAALDAAAARHVAATLTSLAASGLGIVLATHDLALATAIADDAVALREGTAQTGSPEALLGAAAAAAAASNPG
jgi:ABC-type cobalamin/Fe3+-siderophores transport system ATPase subunit